MNSAGVLAMLPTATAHSRMNVTSIRGRPRCGPPHPSPEPAAQTPPGMRRTGSARAASQWRNVQGEMTLVTPRSPFQCASKDSFSLRATLLKRPRPCRTPSPRLRPLGFYGAPSIPRSKCTVFLRFRSVGRLGLLRTTSLQIAHLQQRVIMRKYFVCSS